MSANVVNYRNMKTRRTFLKTATLGATLLCAKIVSADSLPHNANKVKKMKFPLVPLDYPYDALEPYIDAETVAIHHDKHQATYVDKLNAALTSDPGFSYNGSLTSLLSDLDKVPESMRSACDLRPYKSIFCVENICINRFQRFSSDIIISISGRSSQMCFT